MKFDDILINYVGEFGLYQKIQFVLVALPTIFCGWHSLSWTYTGASLPYRCLLDGENDSSLPFDTGNSNYSQWLYGDSKPKLEHSCDKFINLSVTNVKQNRFNDSIGVTIDYCSDGYKWDTSEISNSALKKWEMVCGRTWLKSFVQSMYFVGQFFGAITFGTLADKIGRKTVFFIAITIQVTCGTASAYVPYWQLFTLFRFGIGFAHPAIFALAVIIAIELVGPSCRVLPSTSAGIFYAIGEIILGCLAYGIRDYQPLQLVLSLPALLFISYIWLVPESPRWLISQKRTDEADKILRKVAKYNKRTLPDDWTKHVVTDNADGHKRRFFDNWLSLFKTPIIRKRLLICFVCWATVSMGYFGLAMNPNFLGGDRYLSFIVSGALEVVAVVIVLLTLNIVGRKVHLFGGYIFAAFCLFITLAIPDSTTITQNLRMVLVCVGKMCLTGVFAVVYVITPELFPTVIRTTAVGTCSMMARLGAFAASYIALWLADISTLAVVLIFGITCLIASVFCLFLPETTGYRQLETIEDAENFGTDQPMLYMVWKKKNKIAASDGGTNFPSHKSGDSKF